MTKKQLQKKYNKFILELKNIDLQLENIKIQYNKKKYPITYKLNILYALIKNFDELTDKAKQREINKLK